MGFNAHAQLIWGVKVPEDHPLLWEIQREEQHFEIGLDCFIVTEGRTDWDWSEQATFMVIYEVASAYQSAEEITGAWTTGDLTLNFESILMEQAGLKADVIHDFCLRNGISFQPKLYLVPSYG